ncbi:hypothetical protein THAOC_07125 [Thalassiosira oceanica]|uniref:NADP-dependent oxidoreductase domain-containing protein n=1 Tax=Thalassiosira oceanica TaxID=159749 RepID=K0TD68_THAOC|nr:hypothetical protein THAOC_07125 [Thalassiosira oceanica]|eukprot:EJK71436.1 hypothetical protein THAOC_07125 [Thalassiosira oceanica]
MSSDGKTYGSCENPHNDEADGADGAISPRERRVPVMEDGDPPKTIAVAAGLLGLVIATFLFHHHIHHQHPMTGPIPDPNAYPRRSFITRNGRNITIPVLAFPSVALAIYSSDDDQPIANEAVRHAVEDLEISYFDVAPEYGDGVAQLRLGEALKPYRKNVWLAAKTMFRTAEGSAKDLENTLKALQTDHLDLYQFHSISTEADVDTIMGEGGAMETFQRAKMDGRILAIGFSAHSEPMAIRMIESGLVDTCMFPINFGAYHYGGVGQRVLDSAIGNDVGVIALKSGARGRLTESTGEEVHVPDAFKHIPEWKRQEMIHYPVRASSVHHTWYQPEDDPIELNRLITWSLNQHGVSAVIPPGDLNLLDGISDLLRGKADVPAFDDAQLQHMLERYEDIVPIFHNRSVSGTKTST